MEQKLLKFLELILTEIGLLTKLPNSTVQRKKIDPQFILRLENEIFISHIFILKKSVSVLYSYIFISSVQLLTSVWLCDPMNSRAPGLPVHHQLLEFTQTHVHRVGNAIQPSRPLSSPPHLTPNPSLHQGLFQWVNSLHEVAKVLEFQFQHQSFQWTPGLVSFRMDWLDLLAFQGTLKSLLQHHNSKASILQRSALFTV